MNIRVTNPETDARAIAAVVNAYEPAPVEVDTVKQWFDYMPPGRIARRTVAVDEEGVVVGYGAVVHEAWWPDHEFYVWVGVLPEARGKGCGRRLAEDAQAFWVRHGVRRLTSEVRDDDPDAQRFARRGGFEVTSHTCAASINTETFDETPFLGVFADLEARGIRLCSVAGFGDSPEARRALHEVNTVTTRDIPGHHGPDMPYDEFEKWVCGSEWYRPEGQLIAVDGEKWVGLCAVQLLPQSQKAYNIMTGVVREYRGRAIACGMKIMAIRYARAHGARALHTSNASDNAAMLALNRKLGYEPHSGKYLLARNLLEEERK